MSRSSVAEPPAPAKRKQSWTELADRVPHRREALLSTVAAGLMVVFYLTALSPPGILVWVNYACGVVGTLLIGFFLAHLIPVGEPTRWVLAGVFAVAMVGLWTQFDHFQDRWGNEHGDKYEDWTHRWSGKVVHRTLSLKKHTQSSLVGPMAGVPEKPHGKWRETWTKPYPRSADVWFWYGKRVSQAEWEQHSRQ